MDGENDAAGLKDKVLAYQRTGAGLEELIVNLSPRIYHYPRHRSGLDEDDCGDFYVYFYPRMLRSLEHFRDQGKPFEHYLNAVLRWQLKSYLRRKKSDGRNRALACRPDFWELPGQPGPGEDPSAAALAFPAVPSGAALSPFLGPGGVLKTNSDRRRFLLLLLKNMQFLDARELEQGASLCGYPADELARVTLALQERLAGRRKRLTDLRTRRNRAFCRLSLLEEELSAAAEAAERQRLHEAITKTRATLRLAQQRLARTPRCPTNRDLAEVLGLPKGTVDTALYWLKKRLFSVYAESTEEPERYA
jgi:RNA polymerase sigma factor (sigma-70 family)